MTTTELMHRKLSSLVGLCPKGSPRSPSPSQFHVRKVHSPKHALAAPEHPTQRYCFKVLFIFRRSSPSKWVRELTHLLPPWCRMEGSRCCTQRVASNLRWCDCINLIFWKKVLKSLQCTSANLQKNKSINSFSYETVGMQKNCSKVWSLLSYSSS